MKYILANNFIKTHHLSILYELLFIPIFYTAFKDYINYINSTTALQVVYPSLRKFLVNELFMPMFNTLILLKSIYYNLYNTIKKYIGTNKMKINEI